MARVDLMVNGSACSVEGASGDSLLTVLREQLDLTGAKYGCGEGQCGACTVLLDGKAAAACLVPLEQARGKKIVTIEGLADGEKLHPVQSAFLEAAAFQCGYCTPGMILASVALLETKARPAEREIRAALDGHICRCGTYPRIVQAVRAAAVSTTRKPR